MFYHSSRMTSFNCVVIFQVDLVRKKICLDSSYCLKCYRDSLYTYLGVVVEVLWVIVMEAENRLVQAKYNTTVIKLMK